MKTIIQTIQNQIDALKYQWRKLKHRNNENVIVLNNEQSKQIVEMLENPPEPNENLIQLSESKIPWDKDRSKNQMKVYNEQIAPKLEELDFSDPKWGDDYVVPELDNSHIGGYVWSNWMVDHDISSSFESTSDFGDVGGGIDSSFDSGSNFEDS